MSVGRVRRQVPRWSPDGERIAFFSNRSGSTQVWSINPDGSNLTQLTDAAGGLVGSNWSPDGSQMAAYNVSVDSANSAFVLFDPRKRWNSQTLRSISTAGGPGSDFTPESWSPDGQQLSGEAGDYAALTADNRTLFFTRRSRQSAVWVARFSSPTVTEGRP